MYIVKAEKTMKQIVALSILLVGLFSPTLLVKADIVSKPNGISLLKMEEVNSVRVEQVAGGSRIFQINDGYEEVIIRKVINWLNQSRSIKDESEIKSYNSPVKLYITMRDGDVASIEPIFNCFAENGGKMCTIIDGEILFTYKKEKIRL